MQIYDKDIRKMLIPLFLKDVSCNNKDTYLINELDICGGFTRADVVLVGSLLQGFEIKSPHDSLDRLPRQVPSYNKIFDTMTLITCTKYLEPALKIVPSWWGIYCINETKNRPTIKKLRCAQTNQNIDYLHLAYLLWKKELIRLLTINRYEAKGLKSKNRYRLAEIASQNIRGPIISSFVRNALKHRINSKAIPLIQLHEN